MKNLKFANRSVKMAYELLEDTTPMSFDCGALCGNLCCKGDAQTGMWLFPYEEELLRGVEGFRMVQSGSQDMKLLICDGHCERKYRPLACRIYPFFPMVEKDGNKMRIKIVYDPRSRLCPVTMHRIKPDYRFVKRLRLAVRYLMQDKEMEAYILQLNETINDILEMQYKLGLERNT